MFPRNEKQQGLWAATVLLALCFKIALAAPLACCVAAETAGTGEECHGVSDNATMPHPHHGDTVAEAESLAACAFHQCCVITTALSAGQPPQPALVVVVAEIIATEQIPWGDARIISSYLSRGPPLTLI